MDVGEERLLDGGEGGVVERVESGVSRVRGHRDGTARHRPVVEKLIEDAEGEEAGLGGVFFGAVGVAADKEGEGEAPGVGGVLLDGGDVLEGGGVERGLGGVGGDGDGVRDLLEVAAHGKQLASRGPALMASYHQRPYSWHQVSAPLPAPPCCSRRAVP